MFFNKGLYSLVFDKLTQNPIYRRNTAPGGRGTPGESTWAPWDSPESAPAPPHTRDDSQGAQVNSPWRSPAPGVVFRRYIGFLVNLSKI